MQADISSRLLTEVSLPHELSFSAIPLIETLCKIEIRYRPWPLAKKAKPISTNFIFMIIK